MPTNVALHTQDALLRSWVEAMAKTTGIVHRCGQPFAFSFMDMDGRVLQHRHDSDSYEATLTAVCNARCGGNRDSYNYARMNISAHALSYGHTPAIFKMELERLWWLLMDHLETLCIYLDNDTKAHIAEWITQRLSGGKTCVLSEVVKQFNLDAKTGDELHDFMHDLGFIRDPYWRTVDMPRVSFVEMYAMEHPTMPFMETRTDALLALPAHHPLAVAA